MLNNCSSWSSDTFMRHVLNERKMKQRRLCSCIPVDNLSFAPWCVFSFMESANCSKSGRSRVQDYTGVYNPLSFRAYSLRLWGIHLNGSLLWKHVGKHHEGKRLFRLSAQPHLRIEQICKWAWPWGSSATARWKSHHVQECTLTQAISIYY